MSEDEDISDEHDGDTELLARCERTLERSRHLLEQSRAQSQDFERVRIWRARLGLSLVLVWYGLMFVTLAVSIPDADGNWIAAGICLVVGVGFVSLIERCALKLGAIRKVIERLDFPFDALVPLCLAYWWYSANPLAATMLPWYVALACVWIFFKRMRTAAQRDDVIEETYNSEAQAREAEKVIELRDKEAARFPGRALERGRQLDWAEKEAADLLAEYQKPDVPSGDGSLLDLEVEEKLLEEKEEKLSARLTALRTPHDAELWTDEEERRVIGIHDQIMKLHDYSAALWERIMTISEKRDPEIWGGWRQERDRRFAEVKLKRERMIDSAE